MLRRRLAWLVAVAALIAPAIASSQEASRYVDDYPHAASKKGLQVELVDDALALGVKHAALNVNLTEIVAPDAAATDAGLLEWTYDGDVYRFHAGYVQRLDRDIKALSDHGVVVHLIILAYASGNATVDRCMLHPGYDPAAPNRLGAFNTVSDEGRRWFTATMEFLAERWSRPDERYGRVAGYIIGNEVNSHWWWSNMGRVSMREFADDYLPAVRLAHDAVRRQSSWARVYISLEHHWNMRYPAGDDQQAFAGRAFLDYFATQARAGGDFDWHVAFHPYPENLFEPRFWLDESAQPTAETPRITFKNADVLTDYLERPELLYRGVPRRVIFSEQGFHTPDGPEGEAIQAAAYCYAYRKVAALDGVDAFILHRHVDHPHEGGLQLGLRRRTTGAADPYPKKRIYDAFQAADTPEWEAAFEFALPIVGLEHWD